MTKEIAVTLLDEFALRLVHTGIDRQAFASDTAAVARSTGRLQEDVTVGDVVAYRAYNMAEAMLAEKLRRGAESPESPLVQKMTAPEPEAPMPDSRPTPLAMLGLPIAVVRILLDEGFTTSEDLQRATYDELSRMRGIGAQRLDAVVKCMNQHGLRLALRSASAPEA